jgi:inorganic triphosphatase YgiF
MPRGFPDSARGKGVGAPMRSGKRSRFPGPSAATDEQAGVQAAAASAPVDAAPQAASQAASGQAGVEEIELKLAIEPGHARKLGRPPLIRDSATGRTSTRRMHSVYYDTPERDVMRGGAGLRLRREGTRWVQTLKGGGAAEAGLHRRIEVETRVPAQLLDYRTLAESGISDVFTDPARRARLQPLFTADFTRTTRMVQPSAGSLIEVAVDQGAITAGEASAPVSEVELEVRSGRPEAMLDFAMALVQQVPGLRLEPRSKAERGYALAERRPEAPVKAVSPTLDPSMSPARALRAIVFACVAQLQANEAGVLAGRDVEYLHQARVAMRRLRSALTVFRPGFPRAVFEEVVGELRWLDGSLGPARDWDVFTTCTLPRVALAFPAEASLHALAEQAQRLRGDTNARAVEALRSARYTILLLKLIGVFYREPWIAVEDEDAAASRAKPLTQFARDVLSRRHRRVTRTGRRLVHGDAQHESDHAELHQLRIAIKKLRYAAEFFSALYDRKVKVYTSALAALQELLGGLNDAATVERLCEALRQGDGGTGPEAIGLVRGWAASSARAHLELLPAAWKRFREVEGFWL